MHETVLIWSLPIAITLHNIEEALWLPRWSTENAGRWHRPVGEFEFRFAVTIFTLLAYLIAGLTQRFGAGSFWHYLLVSYAIGQGLNIFIPHLAATIALRSYAPGLLSGVLFVLPSATLLIYRAFSAGQLQPAKLMIIALIFIPVMLCCIPLLFRLGGFIRAWR